MLSSLISAAQTSVSWIIRKNFYPSFGCIYDNQLPLKDLVCIAIQIGKNDEILAAKGGFITYECIQSYIRFYGNKHGINVDELYDQVSKEPIPSLPYFEEGASAEQLGIRYERDPKARIACINHYGCKCYVCGMDFEKTYGELGKGFIEVHHKIPISERGGNYIVNPITDLIPLCSNCHSMVHRRKGETIDVDELKRIIDIEKSKK